MPIIGVIASSVAGNLWPASSYESIASFTPTSGASVSFTSIPSTYQHLQIRYNLITSSQGGQIILRFNGSTSGYARNYFLSIAPSGTYSGAGNSTTEIIIQGTYDGTCVTYPNVGVIDIYDYAQTDRNKVARSFAGNNINVANSNGNNVELNSGVWVNTSAITSVQFNSTYAQTAGTSIALYGIKG